VWWSRYRHLATGLKASEFDWPMPARLTQIARMLDEMGFSRQTEPFRDGQLQAGDMVALRSCQTGRLREWAGRLEKFTLESRWFYPGCGYSPELAMRWLRLQHVAPLHSPA
jgi:hypothetical protein